MRLHKNVLVLLTVIPFLVVGFFLSTACAQSLPAPVLREAFPLPEGAPLPEPEPEPEPTPGGTVSFTEDTTTDIRNPERGFYRSGVLNLASSPPQDHKKFYDTFRQTLAYDRLSIEDYKNNDHLPTTFLDRLKQNLAAMRGSGVKAIIRFTYTSQRNSDATKARQLNHIRDLRPLFNEYADVIAYLEAGFIGQFGEWHDSAYIGNDPTDPQDVAEMREIANALFDSVPKNRMISIRTPRYSMAVFGDSLFDSGTAFSGQDRARLGAHTDGWFTNKTNGYTIQAQHYQKQYDWLAAQTAYTVHTGESSGLRGTCTNATDSFKCESDSECQSRFGSSSKCDKSWSSCVKSKVTAADLHLSALNDAVNAWYGSDVMQRWKDEGCYEEMKRKMGYRFVLKNASFPSEAVRGNNFSLTVNLKNDGFARLYNPRTLYVTLKSTNTRRDIALKEDPRTWAPGGTNESFTESVRIPSDVPTGQYELFLWLPDAANTLKNNPRYSIRFANNNTWNAVLGLNKIGVIKVQ